MHEYGISIFTAKCEQQQQFSAGEDNDSKTTKYQMWRSIFEGIADRLASTFSQQQIYFFEDIMVGKIGIPLKVFLEYFPDMKIVFPRVSKELEKGFRFFFFFVF